MTEPTYTIKPLEWEASKDGSAEMARRGSYFFEVQRRTGHWVVTEMEDGEIYPVAIGDSFSPGEAKLAAESAYRRLLAEHLVEVK